MNRSCMVQNTPTKPKPQRYSSSPVVDGQIDKLLHLILRDFVQSWYSSISKDQEFLQQLLDSIAFAVKQAETRLASVDFVLLVCRDLPEVIRRHVHDYRQCKEKLGTAYGGGKSMEELFFGSQPHFAFTSPSAEAEYLRKVVETLLELLLPKDEFKSDCLRILVREILSVTVIGTAIDTIAEPDYLNQLILMGLQHLERQDANEPDLVAPPILISSHDLSNDQASFYSSNTPYFTAGESSHGESGPDSESGSESDAVVPSMTMLGTRRQSESRKKPDRTPFIRRNRRFDGRQIFPRKGPVSSKARAMQEERDHINMERTFTHTIVSGLQKMTASGLQKMTVGGLERMSMGFDKIKNIVDGGGKTGSKRDKKAAAAEYNRFGSLLDDVGTKKPKRRAPRGLGRRRVSTGSMKRSASRIDERGSNTGSTPPVLSVMPLPNESFLMAPSFGRRFSGYPHTNGSHSDTQATYHPTTTEEDNSEVESYLGSASDHEPLPYLIPSVDPLMGILPESEDAADLDSDDEGNEVEQQGGPPLILDPTPEPPHNDTVESNKSTLMAVLNAAKAVWNLYNNASFGPCQLGPINVTRYTGEQLEKPTLNMLREVILGGDESTLLRLMGYLDPVVNVLLRPAMNRAIIEGIYFLVSENTIAEYFRLTRECLWPNGIWANSLPPRSAAEKLQTKRQLTEFAFDRLFPPLIVRVLGPALINERLRELIEMLQYKQINKQLIFILIDLILTHVATEVVDYTNCVNTEPQSAPSQGSHPDPVPTAPLEVPLSSGLSPTLLHNPLQELEFDGQLPQLDATTPQLIIPIVSEPIATSGEFSEHQNEQPWMQDYRQGSSSSLIPSDTEPGPSDTNVPDQNCQSDADGKFFDLASVGLGESSLALQRSTSLNGVNSPPPVKQKRNSWDVSLSST
ncbi:PXA domain-containing protein [Polychytrium aggregatum]|uniref:PXA domain-containing protein n=1 Tax=Polychytrium aggregatum TaxID=110093 RepID=UPI0022FEE48A|nr:PXA domain-containing protein [Polychytrium aggregatum]KAI9199452.1 PXA domain-containing protein [Polychytrium aggregatum]